MSTWENPYLRHPQEKVGNLSRRTQHVMFPDPPPASVFSFVSTFSAFLFPLQVWWVTRTTHTASLRMSKAAALEEFHRQHPELLFSFSLEWCPLLTQTTILHNNPIQTKITMSHLFNQYHLKTKKKITTSLCLLHSHFWQGCVLVECSSLF